MTGSEYRRPLLSKIAYLKPPIYDLLQTDPTVIYYTEPLALSDTFKRNNHMISYRCLLMTARAFFNTYRALSSS